MKVSVILSYYKQPEILEKTLHIWTNQTFDHNEYEILVMDGGVDREAENICKDYRVKFPNLRYFNYDGRVDYRCPIHSWNVGFKQARADILIVTMEDRLTTFDAVKALYEPHLKHPKIFCTVLPYLLEGSVENNPIDKINWRENPKLLWSISKPTILATKEKAENETVLYSIPRKIMLELGGFNEDWRDYGYWMLDLRTRFINYGLKSFEVSWIINTHHHHLRHKTMRAELFDRQARIKQLKECGGLIANVGREWGFMDGSKEL